MGFYKIYLKVRLLDMEHSKLTQIRALTPPIGLAQTSTIGTFGLTAILKDTWLYTDLGCGM
jgi:hypothetical protein